MFAIKKCPNVENLRHRLIDENSSLPNEQKQQYEQQTHHPKCYHPEIFHLQRVLTTHAP